MKKLLFLACIILSACSGSGGSDGGGGGSEYLNVSDLNLSGNQTSAALSIQASPNCQWVISWNDSWIKSINPTTGRGDQTVTVSVEVNPSSTAARTAVVTIRNNSGSIVRNISLTQQPDIESLTLSVEELNFTSDAGALEVTVNSNTHWTITGGASWMSLNKQSGSNNETVRISVEANTSGDSREATLTFTGEKGVSRQLLVRQSNSQGVAGGVSNPTVSDVTAHEATVSFSFNMDAEVSEYGVCYSTYDPPTLNSDHLSQSGSGKKGSATFKLTGLASVVTYFVRAYAITSTGIVYSNSVSFTTGSYLPGGGDNVTPNI